MRLTLHSSSLMCCINPPPSLNNTNYYFPGFYGWLDCPGWFSALPYGSSTDQGYSQPYCCGSSTQQSSDHSGSTVTEGSYSYIAGWMENPRATSASLPQPLHTCGKFGLSRTWWCESSGLHGPGLACISLYQLLRADLCTFHLCLGCHLGSLQWPPKEYWHHQNQQT